MMRMSRSIGLIVLLWASAAPAQHAGHGAPPAEPAAADPHAGHNMSGMTTAPAGQAGTDLEPGSAPAPAPLADHYADRFWSPQAMSQSRGRMLAGHGGMTMSRIMFNLAEYRPEGGGYRWDAEGWFGGDLNRLVVKSEGEGSFGNPSSRPRRNSSTAGRSMPIGTCRQASVMMRSARKGAVMRLSASRGWRLTGPSSKARSSCPTRVTCSPGSKGITTSASPSA